MRWGCSPAVMQALAPPAGGTEIPPCCGARTPGDGEPLGWDPAEGWGRCPGCPYSTAGLPAHAKQAGSHHVHAQVAAGSKKSDGYTVCRNRTLPFCCPFWYSVSVGTKPFPWGCYQCSATEPIANSSCMSPLGSVPVVLFASGTNKMLHPLKELCVHWSFLFHTEVPALPGKWWCVTFHRTSEAWMCTYQVFITDFSAVS